MTNQTKQTSQTMRLDKFLSLCGKASRSETARAVRAGEVCLNDVPVKRADVPVHPDADTVVFRGEQVLWRAHTYLMLYKPDGVVSATEDRLHGEKTVLDLLPEDMLRLRPALFPCGRLDKHTTGLVILTNHGTLAHRLLAPARHVDKTYAFTVKFPLSEEDVAALEAGVCIRTAHTDIGEAAGADREDSPGYTTAPCRVDIQPAASPELERRCGRITLHEGKYHQIKRMMEARKNQITSLCRVSFGPLVLDPTLAPGDFRYLTEEEITSLERL